MSFYLFAALFCFGVFVATFSFFLPGASRSRTRVTLNQRIGKPSLLSRLLDHERQFLFECGLGERLPLYVYFIIRFATTVLTFIVITAVFGGGLGLLLAVAGFFIPRWALAPIRARRMRAVSEGVIDFGHAFVALLKAGSQPHEAVAVLAGPSGPAAMRGYLTILAHEIRSEGIARAMVKAIDRVADPLFDTLATAILVQSEKGAELSEALQVTIKNIENGAILIRRASSLRLQANMSAIIVPIVICSLVFGLMLHDGRPFAIGGNCAQLGGSYFSYYYTMPWTCPAGYGQFIAMGVVLLFVVGFFVMRQIQKIPPPPRVKLRQR